MSNIAIKSDNNVDSSLLKTLKDSLYPGAKDESVAMVISYCKATSLDPMLKPVHIVPMSVKDPKTGQYGYRDTIMPGIGLYRILAARSGCYAGITEPVYGPAVEATLGGVKITYPAWCRITVKSIVQGHVAEFAATELWIENYAKVNKNSIAPNEIWKKRPYGQLAKCAEAQALRKAFPEDIPQIPTMEEMEGKTVYEEESLDMTPKSQTLSDKLDNMIDNITPAYIEPEYNNITEINANKQVEEKETKKHSSNIETLISLVNEHGISSEITKKWCGKAEVEFLEDLNNTEIISSCISYIKNRYPESLSNM